MYINCKEYIKGVINELVESSDRPTYFLTSLKGIHFQEVMNCDIKIITENALPFLYYGLQNDGAQIPYIAVLDDGMYFGTSIEHMCTVLDEYDKMYNVDTKHSDKRHVYVGVQTNEIKFSDINIKDKLKIHSYNTDNNIKIKNGYGHYYIKEFARDSFRKTPLNRHFPIVEVKYDDHFFFNNLHNFRAECFERGESYEIRDEFGTIKSVSVVLKPKQGTQFAKFIIYTDSDNKIVRILSESPYLLPNNSGSIMSLFDNSPYMTCIWEKLIDVYLHSPSSMTFDSDYMMKRSLITFANYLLSYGLLLEHKHTLEMMLNFSSFNGVQMKDLFYLLGDEKLCNEVKEILDAYWKDNKTLPAPYINTNIKNTDCVVFESDMFHSNDEQKRFFVNNENRLKNSNNYKESLSVLFHNQLDLMEKWTRHRNEYDCRRLRFGYTFESIFGYLDNAGQKDVHKYVDECIDNFSIVPQYILNPKRDEWTYVLRSGDVEDVYLTQLSRYVLFIYNILRTLKGNSLDSMDRHLLNDILYAVQMREPDLNKKLGVELVAKDNVMYVNFGDGNLKNVIDYLLDKEVLSLKLEKITTSNRLFDSEIRVNTYLDEITEYRIKEHIEKTLSGLGSENDYFFIMTYYVEFFQKKLLKNLEV